MRIIIRVITALFVALALVSTVNAQEESSIRKAMPNLAFRTSFANSFKRGNVDDFFHNISQDPTRDVDAGSSAYFDLSIAFPLFSEAIGLGIGVMLFNSHALWGTKLVFGGRAEFVLQPFLMYVSIPMRFAVGKSDRGYICIDPAILIGFVRGDLTHLNGTHYEIALAEAIGFHVPFGIDFYPSKHFGLEFRIGYRYAQARVGWSNPDSPTGYTQFTINDELVMADLSGVFMTMGLLIRF